MTGSNGRERILLLPDGRKVDWQRAITDALLTVNCNPACVADDFWAYVTDDAYDMDKYP